MRKRVVTRAIVVLGVFMIVSILCILSDSHPETIEYHTAAFRKQQLPATWEVWVVKRAPRSVGEFIEKRRRARINQHREALIGLGFLRRNTVIVSNARAKEVMIKTLADCSSMGNPHGLDWTYFAWDSPGTNVVRFVAKPRDAEILTEFIRQADLWERLIRGTDLPH